MGRSPSAVTTPARSRRLHGRCRGTQTDTVTATVADDEGGLASGTDEATVSLTDRPPTVVVGKTASPTVANFGDSVTFTITVHNTSFEAVTLTALSDYVYGNLDGRGTCATGGSIAPGRHTPVRSGGRDRDRDRTVTGDVADNEQTTAYDTASATVTVASGESHDRQDRRRGLGRRGRRDRLHRHRPQQRRRDRPGRHRHRPAADRRRSRLDPRRRRGRCLSSGGWVGRRGPDLAPGGSIAFHVTSPTTFATADEPGHQPGLLRDHERRRRPAPPPRSSSRSPPAR